MEANRRRYQRVDARESDVKHKEYKCLDISEQGMKLRASDELDLGDTFELVLKAIDPPLPINCKVVWCSKAAALGDRSYRVGVEYTNVCITDRARIRKLVEQRAAGDA